MPKILTQLKITEVSAVDRGAGEGVRILLMKRDTDEPHVEAYEKFLKIFTSKAAADGGDDDAGDRSDQNTGLADHPIVRLARLLVASGSQSDLASAVHYLLNTSSGAGLLHRVRTHKGVDPMQDTILSIMKSSGICRNVRADRCERLDHHLRGGHRLSGRQGRGRAVARTFGGASVLENLHRVDRRGACFAKGHCDRKAQRVRRPTDDGGRPGRDSRGHQQHRAERSVSATRSDGGEDARGTP